MSIAVPEPALDRSDLLLQTVDTVAFLRRFFPLLSSRLQFGCGGRRGGRATARATAPGDYGDRRSRADRSGENAPHQHGGTAGSTNGVPIRLPEVWPLL